MDAPIRFTINCVVAGETHELEVKSHPLPRYPFAYQASINDKPIGYIYKDGENFVQHRSTVLLSSDDLDRIGRQITNDGSAI